MEIIPDESTSDWYKVKYRGGKTGYISADLTAKDVTVEQIEQKLNSSNNVKSFDESEYSDIKSSRVQDAIKAYGNELDDPIASTVNDDIFATVNDVNYNGSSYTVSHIVVDDPSQIGLVQSQGGQTLDDLGEETNNLVIGVTGSFFKSDGSGRQNFQGNNHVSIQNKEIVAYGSDGSYNVVTDANREIALNQEAGDHLICIDEDGKIFNAPAGATARDLIETYHVVNTFVSHESPRINNGQEVSHAEGYKVKDRTYLCMKEPGEYYLIQGVGTPDNAMSYAESLGCTFMGSLEQGGAVGLVDREGTITEHTGYQNGIGDMLAFTSSCTK